MGDQPSKEVDPGCPVPRAGEPGCFPLPPPAGTGSERLETKIERHRKHCRQADNPKTIVGGFSVGPQDEAGDAASDDNNGDPEERIGPRNTAEQSEAKGIAKTQGSKREARSRLEAAGSPPEAGEHGSDHGHVLDRQTPRQSRQACERRRWENKLIEPCCGDQRPQIESTDGCVGDQDEEKEY